MEFKRMQLHHWMMIITFSLLIFLPGSQLMTTSTMMTTTTETMMTMSPSSTLTTAADNGEISAVITTTKATVTSSTSTSMPTTILPTTTTMPKGAWSTSIPKIVEAPPTKAIRVKKQEAAKSSILKSNRTNDKTFLRSQSKRELSAEVKSLTLISTATTEITKANITTITANMGTVNGSGSGSGSEAAIINNNNNNKNNNVNNKIVNRSLSIATKGSFNTTVVNREQGQDQDQDIVINREVEAAIVMPAAEGLTATKALTIAGREQSTTMETTKLLATLAPIEQLLSYNKVASTHNNHNYKHNDDDDNDGDDDDADNGDGSINKENIVNNIINNNNKIKHQRSARYNNEGQNIDQTYKLTTAPTTSLTSGTTYPDISIAAVAAAAVAQPPVNNILLATAAAESNLIMTNIEENDHDDDENELKPLNKNHQHHHHQTLATPTLELTTIESTSTTMSPATTSRTTTRRPIPTTTLKPPPTIDDYQTIIAQAGTHAYLPCNVKQLVKKPISWLRVRDGHILTVDQTTFIADQRFQSVYSSNPERWSLQIKYVQVKDEGTYECQVSTEPKASAIVHLRIVEPKTELIGESTRHVKAGSQVKLRCIISQALEPPLFINWFYNQKQIYLHNRRGWRTEIERIDLPLPTTELPTTQAQPATGNAAMTTRPYLLDAAAAGITVHDGGDGGYVLVASSEMTATAQIMESSATMDVAGVATSTAASAMQRTANGIPTTSASASPTSGTGTSAYSLATTLSALQQQQLTTRTSMLTTTSTATTTTSSTTTTTTTTPQPTTTTTTMLPTIAFIKQLTTASLIIPSVVKQDSGNYTCSPSNSVSRTIVLHVLNGEYSASAITSAGVSWQPIFGSFRQLPRISLKWGNVSTFLTVLWIMKFLVASNITIFQCGYSNNGNTTHKNNKNLQMRFYCRQRRRCLRKTEAPPTSPPSPSPPPPPTSQKSTFNYDDNVNNEVTTIATTIQFACNNNDSAAKDLTWPGYAEANNKKADISDSHKRHHKCDSSISGTKVEEDKT